MTIKIRYFASLKESLGRDSDTLELEQTVSVAEIWDRMSTQGMPENTLAAVNMEYVNMTHLVVDGDELAFFPPVTGG